MNKHRLVAALNLFTGILEIIIPFIYLFSIIPNLSSLYSEFNQNNNLNLSYLLLGFLLLTGTFSLFFSFKLFSKSQDIKNKYFKPALIFLIISIVLLKIFALGLVLSTLLPVYNLTKQIN